jgi:hypothetical protein
MSTTETTQEMCKAAKPQKEHEWLTRLVGDWTMEGECSMGPGEPPMKSEAKESVRSLGGLWIVAEGSCTLPDGTPGTTQMTLGYDPLAKRYVGNWIGSMMTHMWVYNGTVDASGKVLTLDTEGPSFADPGKRAKYQDIIEIVGDDERILRSQVQGDDGKWTQFMTAHYRRC